MAILRLPWRKRKDLFAYKPGMTGADGLIRLREKLDDPRDLLLEIGRIMLKESRQAFEEQRFGGKPWKARYPNQSDPKVNIAGVVRDLSRGTTVGAHRFDDRPALVDKGRLLDSLSEARGAIRITGRKSIRVGSTLPYAVEHQRGGESRQTITSTVRKNLGVFMKELRREGREEVAEKLGFLFQREELVTSINERPFVGMTDTARRKINRLVKKKLKREQRRW